jgi:DNA polymerase-3 subunit delta'
VALRLDSPQVLRRLDAVLAARQDIELNVKPRIAIEALTASLRLPD